MIAPSICTVGFDRPTTILVRAGGEQTVTKPVNRVLYDQNRGIHTKSSPKLTEMRWQQPSHWTTSAKKSTSRSCAERTRCIQKATFNMTMPLNLLYHCKSAIASLTATLMASHLLKSDHTQTSPHNRIGKNTTLWSQPMNSIVPSILRQQ